MMEWTCIILLSLAVFLLKIEMSRTQKDLYDLVGLMDRLSTLLEKQRMKND